jgi:hypothetical protein
VNTIIILLLKALIVLALSTFALALPFGLMLCGAFILQVYRRTDSVDPFEWLSYLRSMRSVTARPPEIISIQLWMRRVWRAVMVSVLIAMFSGISLAIVAAVHGH